MGFCREFPTKGRPPLQPKRPLLVAQGIDLISAGDCDPGPGLQICFSLKQSYSALSVRSFVDHVILPCSQADCFIISHRTYHVSLEAKV